jgi:hypothetical protein
MMRRLHPCILVVAILCATAARAAGAPNLYQDTADYPPFKLTWSGNADLKQVRGVFPHPVLAARAVLTTDAGAFITDDAGRTWRPMPAATVQSVGPICDVAFHPMASDTFYMASRTKGVWVTADNGRTFRPIGTKTGGMASDAVVSLGVGRGDLPEPILLAVHGDAAPGMSRSTDGGRKWTVSGSDYCFRCVLAGDKPGAPFLLLTGATRKEPDIQNLYACRTTDYEFTVELLRDVVPTGLACAPKGGPFYMATADSGLYRIDNTEFLPAVKPLTLKGVGGWASVGVTWGPSADVVNLYLYNTSNRGLVVSSDDLASVRTASEGLTVGALVREGAAIRPNANGTVFYAVANGALSVGRMGENVPVVDLKPAFCEAPPFQESEPVWGQLTDVFDKFVRAEGSTVDAAKALCQGVGDPRAAYRRCQVTITARLPLTPSPPVSVIVDLSRLGGPPDARLFDDGRNDDGAAGDGLYGRSFAFRPEIYPEAQGEWRAMWPGRAALGVRATFADGRQTGAVGVMDVSIRPPPPRRQLLQDPASPVQ